MSLNTMNRQLGAISLDDLLKILQSSCHVEGSATRLGRGKKHVWSEDTVITGGYVDLQTNSLILNFLSSDFEPLPAGYVSSMFFLIPWGNG